MSDSLLLPYIELEFRLGHKKRCFDTNIGHSLYKSLYKTLKTFPNWVDVSFTKFNDIFYNNVRKSINLTNGTENIITKRKILEEESKILDLDYRMSLSQEIPSVLKSNCITLQRQKERYTFCHRHWKFELTTVTCNDDITYEFEFEFYTEYVRSHSIDHLKKVAYAEISNLLACTNI